MKQWMIRSLLMVCTLLFATGCIEDDLVQDAVVGSEVSAVLHFGAPPQEQVNIYL